MSSSVAGSTDRSALASTPIRFPIGTDRSQFEQEARHAERVIVEVPSPEPAQQGRLGMLIEASVEASLRSLGAAPPCAQSTSSLDEILSDQLYRARLVGADGLAIAFQSLAGIADSGHALIPEDSLILRRLIEATGIHPIQLCFSGDCVRLRLYAEPEPLASLLPDGDNPSAAVIEYEPMVAMHTETAASASTMQMASELQLDQMIDELLRDDPSCEAGGEDSPRYSLAPPSLEPFTIHFAPDASATSERSDAQTGRGAAGELEVLDEAEQTPARDADAREGQLAVASQLEPATSTGAEQYPERCRVVGLGKLGDSDSEEAEPLLVSPSDGGLSESPSATTTNREVGSHEAATQQTAAQQAATQQAAAQQAGTPETNVAQQTDHADLAEAYEVTQPAPEPETLAVAQPPRVLEAPSTPGAESDPKDCALEQRATQWIRELVSAQGPKPLNSIERLFVSAYVPLADAVANGYQDAAAQDALDDFAKSFERSYSEAYSALRSSSRRPTMTVDVPDLALRVARLHGARSVQLVIVDGMRYDLGQRVDALLRQSIDDRAACAERFLLWSGLPTTTATQLELIGRGPGAFHEFTGSFDDEMLVNRGAGCDQIRRIRTGQREVYKLDTVEARLARAGGAGPKRLEWIAKSVSKSLLAHLEECAPRTLVMIFGDHGFRWEPAGDRNMTIGRQGGASPEEVLVPAYAWVTGSVH